MTDVRVSSVAGLLLVIGGSFLLLQTTGIVVVASSLVWSLLFILGGVAFLAMLPAQRGVWWPAIPGFALLGLGVVLALRVAAPFSPSSWGGAAFLGFLGLGFATAYLIRPANWWAIIPAGTLFTIAAAAAIAAPPGGRAAEGGPIFLLGLAVTFILVYLAPAPGGRRTWALFPAAVFLGLGLITGATTRVVATSVVWPAILIAAGAYLLYRSIYANRG